MINRKNLLALLMAFLIYLPILFTSVTAHNSSYAALGADFLMNLKQSVRWLTAYQGWPFFLIALVSPLILRNRRVLLWWLLAFIPIFLEAAVAKIFFPRYFVFSLIPLTLIIGEIIKKHRLAILVLIPNMILSAQILVSLETAPIPYIDHWQYLESWPSGYGVKEAADFLRREQAKTVITEDIMVTRYGLPYYYPQGNYQTTGEGEYYVYTLRQEKPADSHLVLRFSYPKVGGKERLTVYEKLP